MRVFASLIVALVGVALTFFSLWQVRFAILPTDPLPEIGYVPSAGFYVVASILSAAIGVLWYGSTYLNVYDSTWMRRAVFALFLATFAGLVFGLFSYALFLVVAVHVPGGVVDTVIGKMGSPFVESTRGPFGISVGLLMGYVVWRLRITKPVRRGPIPVKGLFYTFLPAPHSPRVADTLTDLEQPGMRAAAMVAAFERFVISQEIPGLAPRSIVYLDGSKVVPLRPEKPDSEAWMEPCGIRSHAFRVRRGFDELWFVLHLKPRTDTLGFQLDVKQRTRNFVGPVLLLAIILFPVVAWLTGNDSVKFGILICVGLAWLHHLGIVEFLFNKERGDKRRNERIGEYLPVFVRALARALQVESVETVPEPAVVTPAVGLDLLTRYAGPNAEAEGPDPRPRVD